jgi:hypothetical protein
VVSISWSIHNIVNANAYVTSSDEFKTKKAIEELDAKGEVNYKGDLVPFNINCISNVIDSI